MHATSIKKITKFILTDVSGEQNSQQTITLVITLDLEMK